MDAIDFCADVLASGSMFGLRLGSQLAQWDFSLGNEYLDDRKKDQLRRDYGLVEVGFFKTELWICFNISIQVHRLAYGINNIVPKPIVENYGKFPRRINLTELIERLEERKIEIWSIKDTLTSEWDRFWIPQGQTILHVCNQSFGKDNYGHTAGDIWSINMNENVHV